MEDRNELEQKIYAAWLDTIYWITSGTKYRLLAMAGSAQGIYELAEGQLAAVMGLQGCERFLCSTGNAVHRRKCGIISQRPASAIRTVRHLDFRQSLQRYPIRRSGSFTEGGFPMKGYLRWQWSGQGSAVNMEESWLNGLQGGLRSAVWMS